MAKVLITGGAGFIGCNYAVHLLQAGHDITLFDNLSRRGAASNLDWLRERFARCFEFVRADVRDADALVTAVDGQDAVFHLAAQVAVTSSVTDPREDFEINALGTFNVLEAARLTGRQPLVVYASTNKVYGGMEHVRVVETDTRWEYADLPLGLPETQPLDFHSPYGCSKGAGDQYVRDYARIYDLPTVAFRQSCVYGPRQFGIEDQGWLAHFVIAAVQGRPIKIYGDGKQVRDMLWVDDLLSAFDLALRHPEKVAGKVFNIGGGPEYTLAIWNDVQRLLSELAGKELQAVYHDWRPGDQKVYISDIRAVKKLDWEPTVDPQTGLRRLWNWVNENAALFAAGQSGR
ncbi:MAG TPA: NAD-dependent epimerase/dehydratase family protein [Anaerolineales bacterium]|jgi:CDP-paratose 2-epimerase|nr:NAD-dependent epimerase/dehydratase family protein [Anaerolineales bacterium]